LRLGLDHPSRSPQARPKPAIGFSTRRKNMKRNLYQNLRKRGVQIAVLGFLAIVLLPILTSAPASAATLDRIRQSGAITFGYRIDARPFSYQDASNKASGYSVDLCQKIADEVKSELALPSITINWVPLKVDERFPAVQQNKVDLFCGADTVTLARRKDVSFSIPIFSSGIGALLRQDAPRGLREVLAGQPGTEPIWRASPARILEKKTFSVVKGTTSESWVAGRLDKLEIDATVVPVDDYAAGIKSVLDRNSDVFFGDRPILLDAATASPSARELMVLDRQFTYEPLALTLSRGDEDFRLAVDRTLSHLFGSPDFPELYAKWFGDPTEAELDFYRKNVLSE
jgi:ABC-type amino acid transport substrate-binding protein